MKGIRTYQELWRLIGISLVLALLFAACAPAAPQTGDTAGQTGGEEAAAEEPAAEEEAAAEEPAAEAPAEAPAADLPEVPRNRTLIIMNGGPNQ
jgi:hypothetical protein